MNIRKISVLGGLAAGAALALAPLAAAEPTSILDIVNSEIATQNSIFGAEASLGGVPGTHITPGTGIFDSATPWSMGLLADAPNSGTEPTIFGYLLYGLDPIGNAASDPGAYNIFNGASTEFDNAFNVELYAMLNNGDLLTQADGLFGSQHVIDTALGTTADPATVTSAFDTFLMAGVNDTLGYFDVPSI